jgi:D-alanyl-D-alanine carboxypeptidase
MMKNIFIPVATAILIMTSLARASAQESLAGFDDQTVRALTAIAETGRTATGTPGLVVGIWVPGKGKFVRAFGTGDLSTNAPIHPDDHLRIASNTKTFTATAVLQLVDKGTLHLQDHLEKFIPGIPYGNQITIKELLNMSSGIYDFTTDEEVVKKFVDDPLLPGWTPQDVIPLIQSHKPVFPPRTAVAYCDSNYVLLGLIVEKVTGRKVGDVIQTEILDKLGMRNTSYPTTPDLPAPFSRGYFPVTDALPRDVTEINPDFPAGAGAMISTLRDLRIWVKALATGKLLSPATQKLRLEINPFTGGGGATGYGLGIVRLDGFLGHNGAVLGYSSAMFYLPGSDATFVVIGNNSGDSMSSATNIFVGLAYYLFPEQFPAGI